MNEVLTSTLLKGLEAIQKVNKGMGKLNQDKVSVEVTSDTMVINSINFQHQVKMILPCVDATPLTTGIIGVEKLIKAIKKFDNFTTFELNNDEVIVSDGKKKVQLPLGEIDKVAEIIENNLFTVDGIRLDSAYNKVKKSIAKEESRPILTGVHFKNNSIETVDGYRISQVKISEDDIQNDFIINPKALDLILPLSKKDKLNVDIFTNESNFTLSAGNRDYTMFITGELMQGEFLKTDQVFSDEYEYMLSFSENKELLQELEFIKDMAGVSEAGKPLPVKYILNNNSLSITDDRESTTTSASTKIVEMNSKNKDSFKIAFNPNYMIDAIKNISGEFTMQFISPLTPCIIKNNDEKYLVLPVRISA